eukprot:gene7035-8391_t
MATVSEAEEFCGSSNLCVGFTFASNVSVPSLPVKTYFKMSYDGNTSPGWYSYTRPMPWQRPLVKVVMNTPARAKGAVCLDGSPGAFYWGRALDPTLATSWVIFFEGGGWCYSEADCANRARTDLGSSVSYPPTITQAREERRHIFRILSGTLVWACVLCRFNTGYKAGIFGPNPSQNPDFAGANHVYLKYCDGNSFSGDREKPVKTTAGVTLHFRGKRILDAVLDTLAMDPTYNLSEASDVLLTGCSAGGLSTYLHADYIGERLDVLAPNLQRYKAAPCSGFFLDHPNAEGLPVYTQQMKAIFALSNATAGMNAACIAAHSPTGDQWKCNLAQYTYAHVQTPIMVLNSALDCWSTGCILAAEREAPGASQNGNCSASTAFPKGCACYGCAIERTCSASAFQRFQDWEHSFLEALTAPATYHKPGNGAFIYSCYTHCAGSQSLFNSIEVDGVTMQAAVSAWWNDATTTHNYSPC